MNVAVVDAGGNLLAFARQDEAWQGSIRIAIDKAFTSRAFDIATGELAPLAQPGEQFYELDNVAIELIEVTNPREPRAADGDSAHVAGSKHPCFQVDDFDATYDAMVAESYLFTAEPLRFGTGDPGMAGAVAAYFRDSDGNLLEIVMNPGKPMAPAERVAT